MTKDRLAALQAVQLFTLKQYVSLRECNNQSVDSNGCG